MNKPIVHYRGKPHIAGGHACLESVVDHPNHMKGHNISNKLDRVVITSPVVSYDKATGRIETKNTIYMPEVA